MTRAQPLVSVIVCFYNEAAWLDKCLLSIAAQSYKNIEAVLINDGSTDNSLEVAKKYESRFKHFKLLSIPNSGLGAARNEGLKICSGDYVTFLDADDELEPGMIEVCITNITNNNSDLAICNFNMVSEGANEIRMGGWNKKIAETTDAFRVAKEVYCFNVPITVWGKMYKTNIARKILFPAAVWFEDHTYLLEYLLNIKEVSFIETPLLKINSRSNSITRRPLEPKRIIDAFKVLEMELGISKKYGKENELNKYIINYYMQSMQDNFILQIIDNNKIEGLNTVKQTQLLYLANFKSLLNKNRIALTIKQKLLLFVYGLPRFTGWAIPTLLIKFFKRKRIAVIKKIKN